MVANEMDTLNSNTMENHKLITTTKSQIIIPKTLSLTEPSPSWLLITSKMSNADHRNHKEAYKIEPEIE